jgi:hypothetical protein
MKLMTCTGCKLGGKCEHADFLRRDLKGYGIRSMKFACARREDIYQPGQPVFFTIFVPYDDDERKSTAAKFPGHVIKQNGGKVFGFIAPGTPDIYGGFPFEARAGGYVKIPLARVTADEARPKGNVSVCRWCGNHPAVGAQCGKDPNYTPPGMCIADQLAKDAA